MERKEKILLLIDIVIQVLLLLLSFVCFTSIDDSQGGHVLTLAFIYQLFSCIIHQGFPISFFRKIYHWILIPLLMLCAILIVLSVMDIGFALFGLLWLVYCAPLLMIYYLLLTFYETLENDKLP
ncbi:hypothetical protein [Chitinophaga sp. RAB17]|uniref:hypothetical protein n=1 Tax=Chitinophaga sp. RAB17 TaxID=3233049 RepID=UPI003F8E6124